METNVLRSVLAGLFFTIFPCLSFSQEEITASGIPGVTIGSEITNVIPRVDVDGTGNLKTGKSDVYDRVEFVRNQDDRFSLLLLKGASLVAKVDLNGSRDSINSITVFSPSLSLNGGIKVGTDASILMQKHGASIIQKNTKDGKILIFQIPGIPSNITIYGSNQGVKSNVVAIKINQ